jgi:TolB-like protein
MYRKSLFGIKCVFISIFVTACVGFPFADSNNSDTGTESNRQMSGGTGAASQPRTAGARTAPQPLFTGNGGKGLVIAVPTPSMSGGSHANSWMPQLFQDLITADLAKYSAMTVLDRLNESLILAEQELSASGNYSDDDYIAIGHLTNARYIVAGNILGVSGRYSITFRINNTETNEIQASFSKQYVLEDIESGLAAKEAVLALLTGMGFELTAEGERQLLTIQEREVKGQVRLAQGMSAERNNNELQALVYFYEARIADQGNREASQRIQTFGQGSPGASIRERAEWAVTQKARWEKIFNDLGAYVYENLRIVVYDFSTISDQFDARTNKVTLTITPGVKLTYDSTVLSVWKTAIDQ